MPSARKERVDSKCRGMHIIHAMDAFRPKAFSGAGTQRLTITVPRDLVTWVENTAAAMQTSKSSLCAQAIDFARARFTGDHITHLPRALDHIPEAHSAKALAKRAGGRGGE